MKQTRSIMGMPVTVEVIDSKITQLRFDQIFQYFEYIDNTFSTYKDVSEISKINQGIITKVDYSRAMRTIFDLAAKTKQETDGYFDIKHDGKFDPSGVVKGWAILNAAGMLKMDGFSNYYVEAGGDIQVCGHNKDRKKWRVGIRNPFNLNEIVQAVEIEDQGIATSGTYLRGQHIYNPKAEKREITGIVSLSVIGPDICEADRFATAAFAMGEKGIEFIEKLPGFEGYQIDKDGIATYTSGWERYQINDQLLISNN